MSNFISPDRRKEILIEVHCDGGKANDKDLVQIAKFKEYLHVINRGMMDGLSRDAANRYAAMEVYGNVNCE